MHLTSIFKVKGSYVSSMYPRFFTSMNSAKQQLEENTGFSIAVLIKSEITRLKNKKEAVRLIS